MVSTKSPLVMVIIDGWGVTEKKEGNAIAQANTPNMDSLLKNYPSTILKSSGEDVGLPDGQMGNSEVGHLNLGAGRVVYQELTRISRSVKEGTFYNNDVLLNALEHVKEKGTALHFMGLLSDGGVHSHIKHLYALLELARDQGIKKVYIHAFLDGRDVPPENAMKYITALEDKMQKMEKGSIATVMGRYYAMDRDRRWERTEKAYQAMVRGEGFKANTAADAVKEGYAREETDEFIKPTVVLGQNGKPVAQIKNDDAVVFYNFRPDRARQITRAFTDDNFDGFQRPKNRPKVHYVCMTQYDKAIKTPVAFKPHVLVNTLGEVLSYHNLKQLRLAETEKYAHVTFFFNGGVEHPNPGEERVLIPSPRVATYDLKPEMSAYEVTEAFQEQLQKDKYHVIIMNYANPDMVGHTGFLEAAIKAVEVVDDCMGKLVQEALEKDSTVIITADHGNAEAMQDESGEPYTAHTTDPVPFILAGPESEKVTLRPGRLEDVAPTMLQLLGIPQPEEMTGQTLIGKKDEPTNTLKQEVSSCQQP